MTIGIGRRLLVINLVTPARDHVSEIYPMAQAATDAELARLNKMHVFNPERARWEATARLYGGPSFR